MIIKSLNIQNIRSYPQANITFPRGSTLLAGDIGSGKSSILQAIEFALFGIMRGELDGGSLLRSGTQKGHVILEFTLGDKQITVQRALIRSKNGVLQDTGSLTINGAQEQLSATELRKRVIELLAYPPAIAAKSPSLIYRYTVYTSQEQMKDILNQLPQERLQTLRAVFGIDTYARIKDNTSVILRTIRDKQLYLEGQLALTKEIDEKINQTKIDLLELEKKNSGAQQIKIKSQEQRTKLQLQFEQIQQTLAALSALSTTAKNLDIDITTIQQQISNCNARITQNQGLKSELETQINSVGPIVIDLEKENDLFLQKKTYLRQLAGLQEQLTKSVTRIANLESNIKQQIEAAAKKEILMQQVLQIQTQEQELQVQVDQLNNAQTQAKELTTKLLNLTANQAALATEKERLTHHLNHLDGAAVCDLCLQPISPEQQNKTTSEKQAQLSRLILEMTQTEKLATQVVEQQKILESQIEKLRRAGNELFTITGKKESLIAQLQVANESKEDLNAILQMAQKEQEQIQSDAKQISLQQEEAENQQQILSKQKEASLRALQNQNRLKDVVHIISQQQQDLKSLQSTLHEKRSQREKLDSQLSQIDSLKSNAAQIKENYLQAKELEQIAIDDVTSTQTLIQSTTKTLTQLMDQAKEKEKIKNKLNKLAQQKNWIQSYLVDLLSIIEQHVFSTVHSEFNSHFTRWLRILLDDEALQVTLDQTLTPLIRQNGYDVLLNQLSGGEKTSIALAYRLALNRVVSDVFAHIKTKNILILDEPTDGFSEEQLDKVRDVLQQLAIGQLLIVSHEPKVETFVDNVLRINKENHISSISQV